MVKKVHHTNTAHAAINAALAAVAPPIEPPGHVRLSEREMVFWPGIIKSRSRDEWSAADLVVAAQLARCQSDIELESEALKSEGSVLRTDKGTPVMNPRHAVMEQLSRREMALMRTLQMGGSAKGQKATFENARKLQRQAEKAKEEMSDDDLLAM